MYIPFHKPFIKKDEINAVVKTLKNGWLTMGPKTAEFEDSFKKYIGSKHAIAVNSCTAALHLALKAIDLQAGDEVIIPAMTFAATGEVVCYFGAKPVLVDIEKDTHNMDISKIEKVITHRTKAIIPVHYGGQPCDMNEIRKIAKKHRLYIIEDAAHSLPASYKGKKIGTIGDMTCFSFYATKTLTTGEGGMVTTQNRKWAEKIKILRLHGISKDAWKRYSKDGSWYYEITDMGYKYNMTDIQAALGMSQLKKVERMWKMRREIAKRYNDAFKNIPEITVPFIKPDRTTAWHLYVIRLNTEALKIDRNGFIKELGKRGVSSSVHFIPLHMHPYYRKNYGYKPDDLPNACNAYKRIISLPIYPGMTRENVQNVIRAVRYIINRFQK